MTVRIEIISEYATDALQELAILAAPLASGKPAPVQVATETSKTTRARNTSKQETAKPEPVEDPAVKDDDAAEDPADGADEQAEGADEKSSIPTVVDLRAKAQEVGTTPEAKKAIKALLDKYKYPNITGVPEENRAAFMKELEGLA